MKQKYNSFRIENEKLAEVSYATLPLKGCMGNLYDDLIALSL